MERKSHLQGFMRFFIPVIEVLKELGGSGRSAEVTDLVIEMLKIPENEQEETLKSGASRVRNQVAFARLYLFKSGFLGSSQHGVWSLTEKGLKADLTEDEVNTVVRDVQKRLSEKRDEKRKHKEVKVSMEKEIEEIDEFPDYKTELLNTLKSLSPNGFERVSQRLLREAGFEQVVVTGRSGDGGIDGHGILQLNPFVSFRVLFQCKRYKGSVSASQVRDFRGAMMGRADKGIIITTGSFTLEAKKEARRDGVPPIEIVDGDKLVEMFERLELGLRPKKDFEVDYKFFDDFKK